MCTFARRFLQTTIMAYSITDLVASSSSTSTTTTATRSRSSRWSATWQSTATGKEARSYDSLPRHQRRLRRHRPHDYSEEWAKFILLNRNNSSRQPAHDYDIVIGPIANDRVGVQLWKYENRSIDLPTLVHNLRNMRGITFQYFFGTERAIKILKRL